MLRIGKLIGRRNYKRKRIMFQKQNKVRILISFLHNFQEILEAKLKEIQKQIIVKSRRVKIFRKRV